MYMSEACLWAYQGGMRLVPVDMCTLVPCSVGAAPAAGLTMANTLSSFLIA